MAEAEAALAAEASNGSAQREEDALKDVHVSLDEARDFLFTSLRSLERFSGEARATLELLQGRKPGDEWILLWQEQLHKGRLIMQQQQELWEQQAERMDAYVDSVRQLANELALNDLSLQQVADSEQAKTAEQDGRFVHPELHRFKLEKTAKIVGKYGGSPALGAMVMPRLAKDAILKATASPAAREIHYSKAENKEAVHLAEVIRFKAETKEKGLAGWQDEVVTKRGKSYLEEQQAKGVAPTPPAHPSPLPADLANKLAQRQAAVEQAEQDAAQQAQREAALKASQPAQPTGELAEKLLRRQRQAAEEAAAAAAAAAEAAAAAAEAEVVARGVDDGSGEVTSGSGAGALNAELSQVLKQRRVAKAAEAAAAGSSGSGSGAGPSAASPATPGPAPGGGVGAATPGSSASTSTPAAGASTISFRANLRTPPTAGATPTPLAGATNELLERFQKMRRDPDDAAPST